MVAGSIESTRPPSSKPAMISSARILVTAIDRPAGPAPHAGPPLPEIRERAERMAAPRVAAVLAVALGSADPGQVAEIVGRLEELARLLGTHRCPPAEP
jgi:hypothetical protein